MATGYQDISTVMITGGCGFIPSNFVNYLLKESGVRIVNYDCLNRAGNKLNVNDTQEGRYVLVVGDVRNRELLDRTLRRYSVDAIVHFAALTHVDDSYQKPEEFVQTNVLGTLTLLEAVRTYGHIKRFLYISTDEIYGESTEDGSPKKEQDNPDPTNPYSASKLSAEHFVHSYRSSYAIPASIVRMCNVYGPRQSMDKVVPKFIKLALEDKPFTIQGDGSQLRCWLCVSDACRAIDAVLWRGTVGETYNIGSTFEISVMAMAWEIKGAVDNILGRSHESPMKTVLIEDRPHNDHRYNMDCSKIQSELGWSEEVSFRAGLRTTVEWYIANRTPEPDRERILVYGAGGWIGRQFIHILEEHKIDHVTGKCRLGDDSDKVVEQEILEVAPTHVASFIGRTHGPGNNTVDFLEGGPDKLAINLQDNLFGSLLLADVCRKFNIHYTYIGSGCIFTYSEDHPVGGEPFTEDDAPNFFGSSYRRTGLLKASQTDSCITTAIRSTFAYDSQYPVKSVHEILSPNLLTTPKS